jgi:uncharacterized membrane protein HdeD (DUF308 family)
MSDGDWYEAASWSIASAAALGWNSDLLTSIFGRENEKRDASCIGVGFLLLTIAACIGSYYSTTFGTGFLVLAGALFLFAALGLWFGMIGAARAFAKKSSRSADGREVPLSVLISVASALQALAIFAQ